MNRPALDLVAVALRNQPTNHYNSQCPLDGSRSVMSTEPRFAQVIEVRGHIIDSMILPRILDDLMDLGVEFNIEKVEVGRQKRDTSYARVEIVATSQELLERAVDGARRLGALPLDLDEVTLEPTTATGVAPEEFYS